jgi:GTP-binding protein Era
MVIGAGGKMIRAIGRSSRLDMERVFGTPVFLDLRVRVDKKWSKNPRALRRLGY